MFLFLQTKLKFSIYILVFKW